jgi:hypothetical protein
MGKNNTMCDCIDGEIFIASDSKYSSYIHLSLLLFSTYKVIILFIKRIQLIKILSIKTYTDVCAELWFLKTNP